MIIESVSVCRDNSATLEIKSLEAPSYRALCYVASFLLLVLWSFSALGLLSSHYRHLLHCIPSYSINQLSCFCTKQHSILSLRPQALKHFLN